MPDELAGTGPPDTERIVEQAIERVLEAAPEPLDVPAPDEVTSQPWAEKAAPPGKNKRSLEELLKEYAARVAADPDALAAAPTDRHPAQLFFDRLSRRDGGGSRQGRGRRWRQKPRRGQRPSTQPAERSRTSTDARPRNEPVQSSSSSRRRSRRRRR